VSFESERLWIVILALVSFLGGGAAGLLGADGLKGPPETKGAFSHYEELLSSTFDLDPEKRRELRWVLNRYERDLEDLKARHLSELEPELIKIGALCRDQIVKYVLGDEHRDRFLQLASGALDPNRSTGAAH